MGTNKGLNIYSRSEQRFYSYTKKSGFVGIETSPQASCADRAGSMWFGTVMGVTRYNPSREFPVPQELTTRIYGMEVNHKHVEMSRGPVPFPPAEFHYF